MAANEVRDTAEDWLLPETTRARTFSQLESRVHVALTLAQASEAAVREVGAAAIEAAEQARQAAELAERAATAAQEAATAAPARRPEPAPEPSPAPAPASEGEPATGEAPAAPQQEEWLIRFTHRAERLSARLDRLKHC
ncbi:MAG TPA: hypothetical protein VGI73_12415 [Solirubrobacterales bacterium]|jgi:hypothetical protein